MMDDIFEKICSFDNLLIAYKTVSSEHRYKAASLKFYNHLEENLIELQNELLWGLYKLGDFYTFVKYEPKRREINALPYRDRVVQSAICNIIEPEIQKTFIYDSYACIKEKGALHLASQYVHEHNDMHESIDEYIEEHIPFAKVSKEGIRLFKKGKELDNCDIDCLKLHKLLLQCVGFRNYFTTNYDNLLEVSIDNKKRPITIIKRGKELSNTSANCKIIKIHGSLEKEQNDSSGFDGCNDTNFIITQEDYDSYKEKHSAFKTILNTEMLQGVFFI